MEQADGVCVFVTSNKPEQLDEAIMKKLPDGRIVTRPGRIDSVVEFNNPTMKGKLKIAKRILRGMDDETLEQLVEDGEQDTGAEFQQRCFKVAETFFWAHYEESADAERDGREVGNTGD
jgi:SpoVK/Ycf46/Vps4 family AAA+-type ATPase